MLPDFNGRIRGKEFVGPASRRLSCGHRATDRAGRRPALPLAAAPILRRHLDMRPSVVSSGTLLASESLRFTMFLPLDRGYMANKGASEGRALLASGLQS
jgi:hypothetical protein